jgi:autotransporter-associated beta strand protein
MNSRILGTSKTLSFPARPRAGFAVRIAVALGCGILAAANDAALAITLDGTRFHHRRAKRPRALGTQRRGHLQGALTALLLVATAAAAPAADRYWSGTGTWTTTTATRGTVTLGGPITAAGLTFYVDGYTITGNTLTLSGTPSIDTTTEISARIASTLAGGIAIAKTGNGTLELTARNTYTGSTTISGGILTLLEGSKLSHASSNWTNPVVTVSNGAVLQIVACFPRVIWKKSVFPQNLVLNAGTIRLHKHRDRCRHARDRGGLNGAAARPSDGRRDPAGRSAAGW